MIFYNIYNINNYIFIKYFTVENEDPCKSKNIDSENEDDICWVL